MIKKIGTILFILLPLILQGQINETHVPKISRYINRFTNYSDTLTYTLTDSMDIEDWRKIEVLTRLSDITHEAYLHAYYISGMLDMIMTIEDKNERTSAVYRTAFYIKGAIMFMKIANKILVTELKLTEDPKIISIGKSLKEDTEKFTSELETVKNDLEYEYSYNAEIYNH